MEGLRTIAETWFRRVWLEANETAIDEMMNRDMQANGLGSQVLVGPEGFKDFHRRILSLIESVDIRIDKSMEIDDWIDLLCTVRAQRKDNGAPVQFTGQTVVRFKHGLLVEAYNHWDFISLFEQLDLLPKKTFDRCLQGEKIA